MLKRKMTSVLKAWKEEGAHVALNIYGARQVGKSTVVREFGRSEYEAFIEINFIGQPDAVQIFEGTNGAEEILRNLTAFTGQSIIPGNTLILLDEIEECPAARTAIKFLVEDGRAHYIETGSMLGIHLRDIRSLPVGFERSLRMYPMDFEEFLWARRVPDETIVLLHSLYEKQEPVPEAVHQVLMRLFYEWLAVGGMPKAVQSFVEFQDMAKVFQIQKDILDLYEQDITKCARSQDRLKIMEIFRSIPAQLDQKNRRFQFSMLNPNARFRELESSFLWLSEAATALPCYNVRQPQMPLILNEKRSLFRLYMSDTGLLCAASLNDVQFDLLKGRTEINAGSILENAFAQALVSKGKDLFYYDSKAQNMELDFVVGDGAACDVLEIKSGNEFKKHKALDKALVNPEWDFKKAIVFSKSNIERDGDILYLPFYMVMFYGEEKEETPAYEGPDIAVLNAWSDEPRSEH